MYTKKYAICSVLIVFTVFLFSCGGGASNHQSSLKTDADSASYYLGWLNGSQLATQGMTDIDAEMVAKGWQDAYSGVKLDVSEEQAMMALNRFFMTAQTRISEKTLKEGQDFLEANKKKQGVVTLPSGVQYKIIKEGTGIKPKEEDIADVVYHGTLIDGTVFDSSKDRKDTAQFPVNQVVAGFTEALLLMNEGSVWEVYIPAELGYGTNPPRGSQIKPNSTLIFEIDMVKVNKQEPQPVEIE